MNELWSLWTAGLGLLALGWMFLLVIRGWLYSWSGNPITFWKALRLQISWTIRFVIWSIKFLIFLLLFAIPVAVLAAYFWWRVGTTTALTVALVAMMAFLPYFLSGLAQIFHDGKSKNPYWRTTQSMLIVMLFIAVVPYFFHLPSYPNSSWKMISVVSVILILLALSWIQYKLGRDGKIRSIYGR